MISPAKSSLPQLSIRSILDNTLICSSSRCNIVVKDSSRALIYFPRSLQRWASTKCTAARLFVHLSGHSKNDIFGIWMKSEELGLPEKVMIFCKRFQLRLQPVYVLLQVIHAINQAFLQGPLWGLCTDCPAQFQNLIYESSAHPWRLHKLRH